MNFQITGSDPCPQIVERLLLGLPEWFGIPESVKEYVTDASHLPTLVARADDGDPVGVLVHRRHFPESLEIHVMAVTRGWHRHGVGSALVDALTAQAAAEGDGAQLISVKTLGPSHPDPGYAGTRRFYRACGFLPVEELDGVWDEANPCLLMVKPLRRPNRTRRG